MSKACTYLGWQLAKVLFGWRGLRGEGPERLCVEARNLRALKRTLRAIEHARRTGVIR